MFPMYVIRAAGGLLYLGGALIMAYNICHDHRRAISVRKNCADDRNPL
jgi:cytochrome c oxidase cbb3-type subunit 1